jgi:hypothetical protein
MGLIKYHKTYSGYSTNTYLYVCGVDVLVICKTGTKLIRFFIKSINAGTVFITKSVIDPDKPGVKIRNWYIGII